MMVSCSTCRADTYHCFGGDIGCNCNCDIMKDTVKQSDKLFIISINANWCSMWTDSRTKKYHPDEEVTLCVYKHELEHILKQAKEQQKLLKHTQYDKSKYHRDLREFFPPEVKL